MTRPPKPPTAEERVALRVLLEWATRPWPNPDYLAHRIQEALSADKAKKKRRKAK